jgi:type IV pilus assembly protein PilM
MAGISRFFHFFKQNVFPSYLGVDIGTTSIKIAEVKQGEKLPQILNYGILESSGYLARTNQALQTSTLKLFEREVVEFLRLLVAEMKPGTRDAVASLPPFSVFTTVLDLPSMKSSELEQSIVFQAKQYIPLPLSEVAIDWLKVGEFTDEKGFGHDQILLISVPQENIKRHQRIFKSAGLNLRALEVEGLSLARILGADPTPTLVVDIGSRSTNILFIEKGRLKMMGQSDFAGASLTQSLAVSLGINPLRAEELKIERGISDTGPNYELSTIMLPFLDAIINEVKKAQYRYGGQFHDPAKIERAVLVGGGANLLGVGKYFERELGVPVVKAAPFMRFEYPAAIEPFIGELSPQMGVALGLALKEFM